MDGVAHCSHQDPDHYQGDEGNEGDEGDDGDDGDNDDDGDDDDDDDDGDDGGDGDDGDDDDNRSAYCVAQMISSGSQPPFLNQDHHNICRILSFHKWFLRSFPHSRFGHFQCPKRKPKNTFH